MTSFMRNNLVILDSCFLVLQLNLLRLKEFINLNLFEMIVIYLFSIVKQVKFKSFFDFEIIKFERNI